MIALLAFLVGLFVGFWAAAVLAAGRLLADEESVRTTHAARLKEHA